MYYPFKMFETDDIVAYVTLDGRQEVYKVLKSKSTIDNIDVTLQIVNERGGLGKKQFTASYRGKKNGGEQRIFKLWIQVGDFVIIKQKKGKRLFKVECIYNSMLTNTENPIYVDFSSVETNELVVLRYDDLSNNADVELVDSDSDILSNRNT